MPEPQHVQHRLAVLAALPRETFVPAAYRALAYTDVPLPLAHGETMMKPVVEGRTLQLIGLSSEASQLVPLLQDAPQWRKVNLTGVLQADGAASGRDRFTLTAELQPLPSAAPAPAPAPTATTEAANADAKRTP